MNRRHRALVVGLGTLFAVVAALLSLTALAEARPGGGHSYSGGGDGGGGGGGGGGDGAAILIHLLIRLVFVYPQLGIPLVLIVVVGFIYTKRTDEVDHSWDSSTAFKPTVTARIDSLKAIDPQFSEIIFSDFCYALYARAQRARHDASALGQLAPYLTESVRHGLTQTVPIGDPVVAVAVGAMRITRVTMPTGTEEGGDFAQVVVVFEANVTTQGPGSGKHGALAYVTESWVLGRHRDARTKPPELATNFACPNCGGVFEAAADQTCTYCGEDVQTGRYDWQVWSIDVLHRENRGPKLTGHAPEKGTHLPTITGPGATPAWTRLTNQDPSVTMDRLGERLVVIYEQLNQSWNQLDLRPARPFVSDNMFEYLSYWTSSYKAQGLRNVLEGATITSWVIANVTRDVHYDAVTVRIWADGLDYTVNDAGKVLGGDKRVRRAYSEYWTLIRGSQVRGEAPSQRGCPKCGAELQINMAGICEFCNAHLTSGEFDWVLSKIEQDEAYHG